MQKKIKIVAEGLRFNENKVRHDLLEPFAIEELAKVFTKGAEKYEPRNWEKGMQWSKVIASLKRHVNAFERGEDFDFDPSCNACKEGTCKSHTGLFHMAHAAWNALALVSYYKKYPQGDDRVRTYMNHPKIGLDIDEVVCDWVSGWVAEHKITRPKTWFFDRQIVEKFDRMKKNKTLDKFYANLKPLISPDDIPFEPHCYVTSRPVSTCVTEAWLDKHGFPARPVYTVKVGESKVDVLKSARVEIFVDDRFDNFVDLNQAGICTYLYDAPHNQRYNVGHKRIKSLSELVNLHS